MVQCKIEEALQDGMTEAGLELSDENGQIHCSI